MWGPNQEKGSKFGSCIEISNPKTYQRGPCPTEKGAQKRGPFRVLGDAWGPVPAAHPGCPGITQEDWLIDFRIGNKPETLAVGEKLCVELVDVEANPLGELSLPGMSDVRKKRAKQLAFMLMTHTKNRAIQMITRLSDPVNGLEIWRRFLEEWEPVNRGRYRAMLMQLLQCPLTEAEVTWRSGNVLCGSTRRRTWTRSGTQSKQQYWYTTHRIQSGADMSD